MTRIGAGPEEARCPHRHGLPGHADRPAPPRRSAWPPAPRRRGRRVGDPPGHGVRRVDRRSSTATPSASTRARAHPAVTSPSTAAGSTSARPSTSCSCSLGRAAAGRPPPPPRSSSTGGRTCSSSSGQTGRITRRMSRRPRSARPAGSAARRRRLAWTPWAAHPDRSGGSVVEILLVGRRSWRSRRTTSASASTRRGRVRRRSVLRPIDLVPSPAGGSSSTAPTGRLEQCRDAAEAERARRLGQAQRGGEALRRAAPPRCCGPTTRCPRPSLLQVARPVPTGPAGTGAGPSPSCCVGRRPARSRSRRPGSGPTPCAPWAPVARGPAAGPATRCPSPAEQDWPPPGSAVALPSLGRRGRTDRSAAGRRPHQRRRSRSAAYRQRLDAIEQVGLAASRVLDPARLATIALDETIRHPGRRAGLPVPGRRATTGPAGAPRAAATPTATTSTS